MLPGVRIMAKRAKPKFYTEDFKRDAVRLMEKRGKRTVIQIAEDLGVNERLLYDWANKFGSESSTEANAAGESLEQEVLRLRKDNEQLRMERSILKKAAAFFAKDNE